MKNIHCMVFGHKYTRVDFDAVCKYCGKYRWDLDECPECGHENSIGIWEAGVNCENCGYKD